jgi:tape measure domain-containing protein
VADIVSFIVQLVDKVSGPARAAAASTAGLTAAATGAKHALDAIATSRWAQVAAFQAQKATHEIDNFSRKAAADVERINRAAALSRQPSLGRGGDWLSLVKANTALGAIGRIRAGLSGMVQSVRLFGSAWDSETRKIAGESFAESLGIFKQSGAELLSMAGMLGGPVLGAVSAVGGALLSVAKYAGLAAVAATGVGVALSAAFAKAVGKMALLKENTIATFNALTGGRGAESFEKIRSTAEQMGVPIQQASEGIRALTAAGFKGEQAFQWFKRMQDLSAIGVTSETMSRVVLAMSQIKGAGVLQGDELRQLQETGLNIDLIWQNISKEMGVSVQQAKKLKEQGKVSADVALKGIEAAIAAMTGATEAGGARIKWLSTTTQGAWENLKTQGSLALMRVAEQAKPAFDKLRPVLNDITAWFKSDDATKWGERASSYFSFLVDTAQTAWGVLKAFASGFGAAFGAAFDKLAEGKSPFEALKDPLVLKQIEDTGRQIGDLTGKAIDLGRQFTEAAVKATDMGTRIAVWMDQNRNIIQAVGMALMAVGVSLAFVGASAAAIGAVLVSPFLILKWALDQVKSALQTIAAWLDKIADKAASIHLPGAGMLKSAAGWLDRVTTPSEGATPVQASGVGAAELVDRMLHGPQAATAATAQPGMQAATAALAGAATETALPVTNLGGAATTATPQLGMLGAAAAAAAANLAAIGGSVGTSGAASQGVSMLPLPGFASGGPVNDTGAALVHQGEFVVPKEGALVMRGSVRGAGGNTFNVTFNITQQPGEDNEELARHIRAELQTWWESQALGEAV